MPGQMYLGDPWTWFPDPGLEVSQHPTQIAISSISFERGLGYLNRDGIFHTTFANVGYTNQWVSKIKDDTPNIT